MIWSDHFWGPLGKSCDALRCTAVAWPLVERAALSRIGGGATIGKGAHPSFGSERTLENKGIMLTPYYINQLQLIHRGVHLWVSWGIITPGGEQVYGDSMATPFMSMKPKQHDGFWRYGRFLSDQTPSLQTQDVIRLNPALQLAGWRAWPNATFHDLFWSDTVIGCPGRG